MPSRAVSAVDERYRRGALWAAIVVMGAWHLAAVLPTVLQGLALTRPPGVGLTVWLVYGVAGAIASVRQLSGGGRSAALPLAFSPLLLAGVAVIGITSPTGSLFDRYNWAFPAVGWYALVMLWRRPVTELILFYAATGMLGVGVMFVAGEIDRVGWARFVMALYGASVLQVTIFVGGRALVAMARAAAQAQVAEAEIATRRLAAQAVHRARRVRYQTVQQVAAQLLAELAGGTVNPSERGFQQRLRTAVTRLRRLIVETDEVPDPLLHEVRACVDAAERRGVAVDLLATVGAVPLLPLDTRRALTEPLIQALSATRRHARVTVVANQEDVVVAVVADAPYDSPMPTVPGTDAVQVGHDLEEGLLWVQARWRSRLPSPS